MDQLFQSQYLASALQSIDTQGDFALPITPLAQHLRSKLRVCPGFVTVHDDLRLLWLLEGTPNTLCGVSTESSECCEPSTIIHMQPASDAPKIASPSQSMGCRYQAEAGDFVDA
jgi:hypothetical protein